MGKFYSCAIVFGCGSIGPVDGRKPLKTKIHTLAAKTSASVIYGPLSSVFVDKRFYNKLSVHARSFPKGGI